MDSSELGFKFVGKSISQGKHSLSQMELVSLLDREIEDERNQLEIVQAESEALIEQIRSRDSFT